MSGLVKLVSDEPRPSDLFRPLLRKLDLVLSTRGSKGLIHYVKAIRTSYLLFLSGEEHRVPGLAITRDGIPLVLGDLIPKLRRSDSPT